MDSFALNWTTGTPAATNEQSLSLIARCLAGEESAYVTLYNMYAGMTYRLAYGLLQNKEDAEEVMQDSFAYAFRRLDHYDANKSAFKSWLYQITVSRCRNKRRRKWLPTFSLSQTPEAAVPDTDSPSPDDLMQLTERQQLVWNALKQLSPKLRETAVLRYYEGLTYAEIGDILDIPTKTAESRMRLAHKALRELLVEEMSNE